MKSGPSGIWDAWNSGEMIGDNKPNARVTVQTGWSLQFDGEHRYYQNKSNTQQESTIPNIKSISINRSIDQDSATCRITMYNTRLDLAPSSSDGVLGEPGYYSPYRGDSVDNRWSQSAGSWNDVLTPNALIRTYQGYGSALTLTGVWLVDEVAVGTNGLLTLQCRDMAKLLIDQQLYLPLVPAERYPLKYCNYHQQEVIPREVETTETIESTGPGEPVNVPLTYSDSTTDNWYGFNATLYGHRGTDSIDGSTDTFALGVGNGQPNAPYVAEYWQYNVGATISELYVHPWGGPYRMFISVAVGGVWQDDSGAGPIPHDLSSIPGAPPSEAGVPYVMDVGVGDSGVWHKLPKTYNASAVRITFVDLMYTQWGPNHYRAGVREVMARAVPEISKPQTVTTTEIVEEVVVTHIFNYEDYSDIVVELLGWSGFYLGGGGGVYGNIETTGAYAPETCLPESMFDKRPVMDAITDIKNIVGYLFYIDDEGAARFETPNWWGSGNSFSTGQRTGSIPVIDEKLQLTDYRVNHTDAPVRSEIIISSHLPQANIPGTLTTTAVPSNVDILRGMVKPAMWVNENFTVREEQEAMATLIAMHTWFRQRKGYITCVANPCIQIDDQVRIRDRQSGEAFVHYVRSIQSSQDLDTGDYSMTIETNWLGDGSDWSVQITSTGGETDDLTELGPATVTTPGGTPNIRIT